jgi:hypothetical protein
MPTINVNFAGNSSYMVSGTDLENVGRIELAVSYDSLLLTNPGLQSRSSFPNAEVALDTDYSGNLSLTVISSKPMQGRGAFAVVTFGPIGTSTGCINNLTGRLYTTNGSQIPTAIFSVTNPTPLLDASDPDDIPMIKEREAKGQTLMGGDVAYFPPEVKEIVDQSEKLSKEQDTETESLVAKEENAGAPTGKGRSEGKKEGVSSAEIIIFIDGNARRVPITVTPAAKVDLLSPGKVTEADFDLFLKERGTEKAPRFDLNGDGRRDYVDDYIFTANYLLARKKEAGKGDIPQTATSAGRNGANPIVAREKVKS